MNIQIFAEHSVDLSLLTSGSKVLDLGCRGFEFSKAMYDLKCQVFSLDIDDLPPCQHLNEMGLPLSYFRCAVSDYDGRAGVTRGNDPQGTRIERGGNEVKCMTLGSLSVKWGIYFWDVIKIDIEGSEYEVIMSMDKAPAKQLTIEFHLHTGAYEVFEMNAMENKLKALGYIPVKHEYTSEHGAGKNYWDSLFILK